MKYLLLFVFLSFLLPSQVHAMDDCSELASRSWGGFRVDLAETRNPENRPEHCFVRGTIDAEINFELLLPSPGDWNGRFVMGGGGGFVGQVQNQAFDYAPDLLAQGFATVGTDTGHEGRGTDASWALHRIDREINFGYRAIHVTAVTAKSIIRLYYERDIRYSYFIGCSRGGGQGMMASQRYPDDFDGIVAGAPAFSWTNIAAQTVQITQAIYPDPTNLATPAIRMETRKLLEASILSACDGLDGLEDGILNDPRECPFRPESLPMCPDGEPQEGCITPAELRVMKAVYEGPEVEGRRLHPGFPFGGEAQIDRWGAWIVGAENAMGPGHPSLHFAFGTQIFKYLVFDNPDWQYATYDFSSFEADTERIGSILNATSTDLTAYDVAGGKLLLWTGWSDAALTAQGIIDYYEKLQERYAHTPSFARLFLMPGVSHCVGGPGPDYVDWLGAIQQWVEEGKEPQQLVASKRNANGTATLQRPICAYPERAHFNGTGDGTQVTSFECVEP